MCDQTTNTAGPIRGGGIAVLGVAGTGPWPVCGPDGTLLAVYEAHRDDTAKPGEVLARPVAGR